MKRKDNESFDGLIEDLVSRLEPVRVLPHPFLRVLYWGIIATSYVSIAVYFVGLREDLFLKLQQPVFLFEVSMALAMSLSATFAAFWLCIPDMRGQKWLIAPPLILFSVFTLEVVRHIFMDEHVELPAHLWNHCATGTVLFGVVPALAIFILSLKGKTTHLFLLPFMNTLAVGGIGYISLRIVCSTDDIGHDFLYHIAPYIIMGSIASITGRIIYRW